MSSSIVRGRYLISGVHDGGKALVIENGAFVQKDGKILEVSVFDDLQTKYPDLDVVGGPSDVVLPGFVNGHHHVGMTPLQLGSPDLPLELWIARRMAGRNVDLYLDTLYSAFEMVQSGITTVQHIHMRARGDARAVHASANEIIRAYKDVGMRVSYCYGIRDQNRFIYEDDDTFIRRLPPEFAPVMKSWIDSATISLNEALDIFEALYSETEDDDRVRIQLAPANLHWCSDDALDAIARKSETFDVPMHMHLLETPYQREYARRRTGHTAVAHLNEFGMINARMTLGHGCWLSEDDVGMLAGADARVCHNCSSNLRLRSGRAPINDLHRHGVKVGIGIDEAGINDDRDMLQEMRMVLCRHRDPGMDDRLLTPTQVFQMATEHGAATTGFEAEIGMLTPGRHADAIILKWDDISYPYLDPSVPVVDAVVHRAKTTAVKSVMVGGKMILQDGEFTRVDRSSALAELSEKLSKPLTSEEQERRETALAVMPVVEKFYREEYPQEDILGRR